MSSPDESESSFWSRVRLWLDPSPFRDPGDPPRPTLEQLEKLLEAVSSFYRNTLHKRAWVLFDRLDVAFYEDASYEAAALRSLLWVLTDFSSFGPTLRIKLFMRNDLLQRIARDGGQRIVNTSHLRSTRLSWSGLELRALVTRRLAECSRLEATVPDVRRLSMNEAGRSILLTRLVPSRLPQHLASYTYGTSDSFSWLVKVSQLGEHVNPRNLLQMLDTAARREETILRADSPDAIVFDQDPLLSGRALYQAFVRFSKNSLDNLVYSEHPNLERIVAALDGAQQDFESEAALLEVLRLSEATGRLIIDELLEAGVLRRLRLGKFGVSYLFRPALRTSGSRGLD